MLENLREIRGVGASMHPFVPPGSRLLVEPALFPDRIRKGDVVCFIGENGSVTAHRVTRITTTHGRRVLWTRGDAQDTEERIPEDALCYVVRRVALGPVAYRTGSPTGRLIARIALAENPKTAAAKKLVKSLAQASSFLLSAFRQR